MSAESGVPTFRDAQDGLWEEFDPSQLATPEAWRADPAFVFAWYLWRCRLVRAAAPNPGHLALAQWARGAAGRAVDMRIVTQNVDDLHERAGSTVLTHLHGSLFAFRCDSCGRPYDGALPEVTTPVERIDPPRCARGDGLIRPGVVWFGEMLPPGAFDTAYDSCRESQVVLVVGTSGLVYPAAVLPELARAAGALVVEINPDDTEISGAVDLTWRETAAVALPTLLTALAG